MENKAINFINENILNMIEDNTSDNILSFIIALIQYIQFGNSWMLENLKVKYIYKLRNIYRHKNITKIECTNKNKIILFFEKCEELNDNKKYQSEYIIKRIDYILTFLMKGFIIFHCNQDKSPRVSGWNKLTFNDTVRLFLILELEYTNIGLLCGKESNVVVIDIDNKDNGMEYWSSLLEKYNATKEIDTMITTTGSLGKHYYFKYNEQISHWISINKLFTDNLNKKIGIDLRSTNGYVIIPPSINSNYNRQYEYNDLNKNILDVPEWLMNEINDFFVKRTIRIEKLKEEKLKEEKVKDITN